MKIMIITGVTSVIGKALAEKYDGEYKIEGHSRRYNNHDIENIKEWFNPDADVFINNAYSDLKWWAQAQALLFAFSVWHKDPTKHIISVSSVAQEKDTHDKNLSHSRYSAGKLSLDKINFECHEKSALKNGCKLSNLRVGWVNTPRTTRIQSMVNRLYNLNLQPDMLETEQCVSAIDFMLNHSGRVRELTLEAGSSAVGEAVYGTKEGE